MHNVLIDGGKPAAAAGLAALVRGAPDAWRRLTQVQLQYLKPVQTGYPEDSDARLVVRSVELCAA